MGEKTKFMRLALLLTCACFCLTSSIKIYAQDSTKISEAEFGPVMKAYLGYLRNEQEVVDDRASRHEIDAAYYRLNSSRIRALRQMAIRIVRETGNDYVPELEAVTESELGNLFERPPAISRLRVGVVIGTAFKFLGSQRIGEVFYIFVRLNPYEQAEQMQKIRNVQPDASSSNSKPSHQAGATTRPRRAMTP